MKSLVYVLSASLLSLCLSASAHAGALTGAAIGAGGGAMVAGPIGAVAGGVAGAAIGGPNIHRHRHYRVHVDTRGRRYYSVNNHRRYL
jgi:outer membrane lipoprotein SlyB